MNTKFNYFLICFFIGLYSYSQEGIPVYSDYLSDNYYLLHPSMAGASNCAKLRLTARKQWFDQEEAPSLQTLSYNGRIGEKAGGGIILFNDKNGYHSQKGMKLTYAYHLMFSRDEIDLNQLSFGISGGVIQSQLDETSFTDFDPIIFGQIQKDSYFNVDVGMSYNYLDFYVHATIQGLLETRRDIYTEVESDNLRKFILNTGYIFGDKNRILWEPSIMFQYYDVTKQKAVDINMKAYKNMDFGSVWGGLSYRTSFDGAEFNNGNGTSKQRYQSLSPVLGVNYNNFMFAYTYSHLGGDVKFGTGGFHQITLGLNLFCKREKYECNCPAIN